MGTLDTMIDLLLGDKPLDLKVVSWQQSIHAVNKSGNGDYPIGEHRIELRCNLQQTLSQGDILVGEDPIESLSNLDFKIQLRGARKIFATLETKTLSEEENNASGCLIYHSPIPPENLSGLSSRVIDESKTGSITGWAFFDDNFLWEISRLLTTQPEKEVHLWVTAKAARTPTPAC